MSKKVLIPIVIIILAIIAGGTVFLVVNANSPEKKLSRQLDLGAKYLSEEAYEQAIVAFDVAISIDPKNVDAYLGKAEAYIGLDDYESAIDTLLAGYNETEDKKLKKELQKVVEDYVEELVDDGDVDEAIEFMEDIQEDIGEELFDDKINGIKSKADDNHIDVSIVNDGKDESLPYVSLKPLVDSATIDGKPWYEWTVDSLSEHYALEYESTSEDGVYTYYRDANDLYGKTVASDQQYVYKWAKYLTDDGARSDMQLSEGWGEYNYKQYSQEIVNDKTVILNESVAAFALENGIVSCDALIKYYGFDTLGLTKDNSISIDTEYGKVIVSYYVYVEGDYVGLSMSFEDDSVKEYMTMISCNNYMDNFSISFMRSDI